MDRFDVVVVGNGIAGATLAWLLRWKGYRVCTVDREEAVTSSRIAAGLVTPVTGQRMASSEHYDAFFAAARAFYARVEAETDRSLFRLHRSLRLFRGIAEREAFERRAVTILKGRAIHWLPSPGEAGINCEYGGFEMPSAGQLAVAAYMGASRERAVAEGGFRTGEVDPATDLEIRTDGVRLPQFGLDAARLVFCQGFDGATNPYFPDVPFNAAKGEVLTVEIRGMPEGRVVHRGIWIAPLDRDIYLIGSTYDRERLDRTPTASGRAWIEAQLRNSLHVEYRVRDHRAAVRPVLRDGRPSFGWHRRFPRIGFFNGLGSKGSLLAPSYAARFVDSLSP